MNREDVRSLLGETLYARAVRYFTRGRVKNYECVESEPHVFCLSAQVGGTDDYDVRVWLRDTGEYISGSCTCPFNENGEGMPCKHIGALLLFHINETEATAAPDASTVDALLKSGAVKRGSDLSAGPSPGYVSGLEMLFGSKWKGNPVESDPQAQNLLRCAALLSDRDGWEELRGEASCPDGSIHLEPELRPDVFRRSEAPELRLHIRGSGRGYIVKDISEMLTAIEQHSLLRYGDQLSFVHREEAFDEQSRALLTIVRRQENLYRYAGSLMRGTGISAVRRAGALPLSPDNCDDLIALYRPAGELGGRKLLSQPPHLSLIAEKKKGGSSLTIEPNPGSFAGCHTDYFFTDSALWALPRRRAERLQMVLEAIGGREVFFKEEDLASFCSYILPEIRDLVRIEDPDRALLDHIPLQPVVQFYLDAPTPEAVSAYAAFAYGEDIASPFVRYNGSFLRDERTEKQADRLLRSLFDPDPAGPEGVYTLSDPDRVEYLLDSGVQSLLTLGEVYLTDAFRSIEAPRPKISVGISVNGSVLDLTLDTGEFPAEELRGLMDSLHRKKRYHRLRDGRLLRLDDSFSALEDLQATLEDSGASLEQSHAQLPLFRAPGLDRALSGQDGVSFSRDDSFRRLSRSFHAVADTEFALPASLQPILRRYQRTGYRWLRVLDSYGMGGILADDMGLGKTVQVLAFLLAKKQEGTVLPSLIVCPASLVLNWAEEAARFTPQLKVLVMDGNADQRAEKAKHFTDADIVVTGYDLMRRDEELYAKQDFYACILDEAQAVKNQTTQKYKVVCKARSTVRFALTGTPIENRLSELWSIFSFLMPGYLYSYKTFRTRFEKPIVQENDEDAARRLNRLTGPFILRRLKKDVLKELPPKIENIRHVTLGEQQRRLYAAGVLDARERLRAAKPEDRIQVFAALTRLRQICCDPRLAVDGWEGDSAKLEACLQLISTAVEGGHQILLFSQFTSMLNLIRPRLNELGISHFTLEGSTPKPARAELVHRFNAGEASVFLISLKAGGTGLNLTAADIVIHYDPWWNIAAQNQATDRAYRIGQKNTVQVYKLIARDTIEEKILELQEKKQNLADTITSSADGSVMSMTPQELLDLLEEEPVS